MQRLEVDPVLRKALADADVRQAEDLLALAAPPDAHNVGRRVELPLAGTCGRFYLKAYRYPGWRKSKGLVGRGSLWGQAPCVREFHNLTWLRARDLPAPRPVAAAAVRHTGRLAAHALLTEWVEDAPDLAAVLRAADDVEAVSTPLRVLGAVVARMHAAGFVHRDLHARNVLVRVGDDARVWLLDCRRGGPSRAAGGRAFDLATLEADLVAVPNARAAFRRGYEGDASA